MPLCSGHCAGDKLTRARNVYGLVRGSRGIRVVGLLPALFIELPALTFLLRSNYWASVRVCFLAAGGALVGALLMSVTFTGFEPWGAIGGASIGTMQGLICYGHKPRSNDPPTS